MGKLEIKSLIRKGLTAEEVAKLVIQNKQGGEEIFTKAEETMLKSSLLKREDIFIFNWYMKLMEHIEDLSASSLVLNYYMALYNLTKVAYFVKDMALEKQVELMRDSLSEIEIMTKAQAEEVRAQALKEKLARDYNLLFIMRVFFVKLYEHNFNYFEGLWPDQKLALLTSSHFKEELPEFTLETIQNYAEPYKEVLRLTAELQKKLGKGSAKKPPSPFSKLDLKKLSPEEAEKILLAGRDLYKTGIPFLVEYFERYPEDNGHSIAIAESLPFWKIDEKGHYKEDTDMKNSWDQLLMPAKIVKTADIKGYYIPLVSFSLLLFLAQSELIASLTEKIGITLREGHISKAFRPSDFEAASDMYHFYRKIAYYEDMAAAPPEIDIEALKSHKVIAKIKDYVKRTDTLELDLNEPKKMLRETKESKVWETLITQPKR